ncbi:MAG: replication-associated recombination protein A [Spirochaetes bacterium]|nr:replication-associated recombination protein A [Spirochaetota bacterium]
MKDDNTLFNDNSRIPLSEKLRPRLINDILGQEELFKDNSLLNNMIIEDNLSSFILWGPPGSGKTSIANVISKNTKNIWKSFSAVITGIKEVKAMMEEAEGVFFNNGVRTIIFIDEIHRFNKAQQDAFLPYVEKGSVILIGATTENPSFSIISPLLSRMRVFVLKRLSDDNIGLLIDRAIELLEKNENIIITIDEINKSKIIDISSGDARRSLGIIEMSLKFLKNNENKIEINKDLIEKIIQGRLPNYDKKGDFHYDYISALHKSMRNSDVDAAIYYAVKMLESGEDPLYIIRRVIRFSSEDVGMADPNALIVSIAAKDAISHLGMPEANLSIVQAVAYNALAPKSNALYTAYKSAKKDVENFPDLSIPLNIRNAPTSLMKEIGYGEGYQYAHDYSEGITAMKCLPDELSGRKYYNPKEIGFEKKLKTIIEKIESLRSKN